MEQNPNQFNQAPVKGDVAFGPFKRVISAQVSANESGTLTPGQGVQLENSAGNVPKLLAMTADTQQSFGFIVRNFVDIEYTSRESLEIAQTGTVMYLEAGSAIARGAFLEYDVSEDKVITHAGTNPVIGYAFDQASADGDLIRVVIQTPVSTLTNLSVTTLTSSGDISVGGNLIKSVNNYSSGAGALPITDDIIALTTGGAEALSLADGVEGQVLEIVMVVDGGAGTVTPANFANGTTLTFDDVGDSARLVFVNSAWHSIGTATATIA